MFRKQTCIYEVMTISAIMYIASVTEDKKNKLLESPIRAGGLCNVNK